MLFSITALMLTIPTHNCDVVDQKRGINVMHSYRQSTAIKSFCLWMDGKTYYPKTPVELSLLVPKEMEGSIMEIFLHKYDDNPTYTDKTKHVFIRIVIPKIDTPEACVRIKDLFSTDSFKSDTRTFLSGNHVFNVTVRIANKIVVDDVISFRVKEFVDGVKQ